MFFVAESHGIFQVADMEEASTETLQVLQQRCVLSHSSSHMYSRVSALLRIGMFFFVFVFFF